MKRIAVTGATSMIGVALIEEALKNDVEVVAFVRPNSKRLSRLPESERITVLTSDIDDLSQMKNLPKCDVFYHFAWTNTDKVGRLDKNLQDKNIDLTLEMVRLAKKMRCTKFVGAGSQAEYGRVDGTISPSTVEHPEIAYGEAKLKAGQKASVLCQELGLDFVWGRIFSVYGRFDNDGTMINYVLDSFDKDEVPQLSSCVQIWNYLNEHDAGKIFLGLGKSEKANGIYCVASHVSQPLLDYVLTICEVYKEGARCEYAKLGTAKPLGLEADISRTINDIGDFTEIPFEQGIDEIRKFREHVKG